MRNTLRLSPRGRGCLAIVLLSGVAFAGLGCDGDNEAAEALRSAEVQLRAMMPGREQVPGEQMTKTYTEVIGTLTPVSSAGTPAQQAAAAGIIAQAHAGLAQPHALRATDLEQETLNAILQLRAAHTKFMTLSAMAQAAAAYDPQPEIAQIEKQLAEREQELQQLTQKKGQVDQQAKQLRDQAAVQMEQGRVKRQEAATLKGKVANETATRGEELMKQAHELSRQADQFEVKAAELEAQAATIEPDSAQAQLDIDRVNEQKTLLNAAREKVNMRAQANRAEAAELRQAAQKVAEEIQGLVNQVSALRTEELAQAHQEAVKHLETAAASAARSASGGATRTAKMAEGAHRQALGDLAWARAQGHTAWAESLETLATAQPALPNAAEYKAKADAARAEAKEMLDRATEAYDAANSAYQSAGGGGEAQQQIARINNLLAQIVDKTSGGSKDIRVAATPVDEGGSEAVQIENIPAEGATPNDTLAALKAMSESGDMSNFDQYIIAATPADEEFVAVMTEMSRAGARLQAALTKQFGAEGEEALKMMAQQGGVNPLDLTMDPAEVQFEIEGDRATAQVPGGQPMEMRQVDGQWKIVVSSAGMPREAVQALRAAAPAMAKSMEQLAADVEAGKYASVQEASAAMMQKMMEAMMQGMPGGPG